MERIKKIFLAFILIVLGLSFFSSCSSPQIREEQAVGVYHQVKKGETAYSIARAYNIKLQDLADINGIKDPAVIKEGRVLFIPGAKYVIENVMTSVKERDSKFSPKVYSNQKKKPAIRKSTPKSAAVSSPEEEVGIDAKKMFIWPVKGKVKTRFGKQPNKTYYNWIKIVAPVGSKVKAAAAGMIIFSSHIKDYGQTVIIRHEKNYTTVYTHLNKRYVKADQRVKQGEAIALLGKKEKEGMAYINFEIRIKGKARDPLLFLP